MDENTKKHAEIALAIKAAKKKMFKSRREGLALRAACDQFMIDAGRALAEIVPEMRREPANKESPDNETLYRARAILENPLFDEETQESIRRARDSNDPMLGEMVSRAQEGKPTTEQEPWKSPGRRRGSNETFEVLSDLELKEAARGISDNSCGHYFTGLHILVIEHLGALAFAKRFNDLDMAICDLREWLVKGDDYAWEKGLTTLREETRESLSESINTLFPGRIASMAQELSEYADRQFHRNLGGAA
jgi:hypothetical protein